MITQRPKGTQDWYGENMHKRTVIEKLARELAEKKILDTADVQRIKSECKITPVNL